MSKGNHILVGTSGMDGLVANMRQAVEATNDWLGNLGFVQGVDEIAILCRDEDALHSFLEALVRVDGFELFNMAPDHIKSMPFDAHYYAEFWFFRTPIKGVRFEVMRADVGSPLHDALRRNSGPIEPVHASFKCEDEVDYASAIRRLSEAGLRRVQDCEASYGRYSYWMPYDESPKDSLYVKPRVNLRDPKEALS